jgi:hypothetical protein
MEISEMWEESLMAFLAIAQTSKTKVLIIFMLVA